MNKTIEHVQFSCMHRWSSSFGIPITITTDQGHQFESSLWTELMKLLGIKRIRTTAYHPIANGIIKHFHRQLKASIKSLPLPTDWFDGLPLILLGIRTAIKRGHSVHRC